MLPREITTPVYRSLVVALAMTVCGWATETRAEQLEAGSVATILEAIGSGDPCPEIQRAVSTIAAIHLAGRLGIHQATDAIRTVEASLGESPCAEAVRLEIEPALLRLGESQRVRAVTSIGRNETGLNRLQAAQVLLEFDRGTALKWLESGVRSGRLDEVQFAVNALAREKCPLAREYLLGGLAQSDPIIRLECAAQLALGGWSDGEAVLRSAFHSADPRGRFVGACGLALLGDAGAADYLLDAWPESSLECRLTTIEVLGVTRAVRAEPLLESVASQTDADALLRDMALRAIANIRAPGSVAFLGSLATNHDIYIRVAAAGATIQVLRGIALPMPEVWIRYTDRNGQLSER